MYVNRWDHSLARPQDEEKASRLLLQCIVSILWVLIICPYGCVRCNILCTGGDFILNICACCPVCRWVSRSPEFRGRRRKGNPVNGGLAGRQCHWGYKYRDLVLQVGGWTQGWRPYTVKKLLLRTPKKWKPKDTIDDGIDKSGRNLRGRLWLKKGCFANDDDGDLCVLFGRMA
jgi:hypothetical protein